MNCYGPPSEVASPRFASPHLTFCKSFSNNALDDDLIRHILKRRWQRLLVSMFDEMMMLELQ
jgi:hypothetical protein